MAEIDSNRETFTTNFFKGDTEQAVFTGDAMTDKLMHAVIALGSEVWTLRQRGKVLERLLEDKGVTSEMVEGVYAKRRGYRRLEGRPGSVCEPGLQRLCPQQ